VSAPLSARDLAFELSSLATPETTARRRGATAYLAASAVQQVAALLRYVLLARLIGPEQLGLAATLILTASFFDLISDTASDRYLIQDKDGDQETVQNLVQLVLAGRGVMIAAALAISAWPVSIFYKAPALAPALAILGLSPLIAGFIHLDMRRAQRDNDFRAEGVSTMASEVAGLIGTVVAAYLTHSFTAVLYGVILRSVVLVLCSHLFAQRRYRFGYSAVHGPKLARFSAPLMVTGLILFLGGQGDRVLVLRNIGFTALGHYSAVILLIYYPAAALLKYAHAIYLPLIAGARSDPVKRAEVTDTLGAQTLLLAVAMSAGFALVAPFMVGLLYGRAFSMAAPIVALIGILQAARFLVLWPTTVALAMARTTIVLANNVLRLVAWPAALVGVAITHDLYGIVSGFIFGEFIAFAVALVMLNRSEDNPMLQGFDRFAKFVGSSIAVAGWAFALMRPGLPILSALSVFSLILITWIVSSEMATIRASILSARRYIVRR
jgi:O-antigen/teichoic acid export membrane protein